jgi:hypothetical protein
VALLEWMKEEGCPWDDLKVCQAGGGGSLEVFNWCLENGGQVTRKALFEIGRRMCLFPPSSSLPPF